MAKPDTPRPLPRHPKVWWSRTKVKWPILVWMAAAWGAWTLYQSGPPSHDMLGVVSIAEERVGPVDTARLLEVPVQVGQRVVAGDVLARFDTTSLDAELLTERLRMERQFTQLVQDADNALREARINQARDEAELAALNAEWERLSVLRQSNLVDEQSLARIRVPREALAKTVELYPEYIAGLQAQHQEALRLQRTAGAWLDAEASPGTKEPGAEGSLPEMRAAYTLRAQSAGTVGSIAYQPGSVVPAGEPVVTIIRDVPPTIVGYMLERETVDLHPGQTVYIYDVEARQVPLQGTISTLSPYIGPVPILSARSASEILRGRQVTIVPDDYDFPFTPGAAVRISVAAPRRLSTIEDLKSWIASR
jgi:multidrug resistance efflux pump